MIDENPAAVLQQARTLQVCQQLVQASNAQQHLATSCFQDLPKNVVACEGPGAKQDER
jgi:hypothetical protein